MTDRLAHQPSRQSSTCLAQRRTLDFLVLVGYYSMLARIMATLEIELDEGLEASLPAL